MELCHGTTQELKAHKGQCWTPDRDAAHSYASYDGTAYGIDIDLSGLEVIVIDGAWDRDACDAYGDTDSDFDGQNGDIVVFDDEDMDGQPHKTYRLVSDKAVSLFETAINSAFIAEKW